RVLRSSRNHPGRRAALSRVREPQQGRRAPLWPGDLQNDGGGVSAAGANRSEARLDGTLRPDDRHSEEVRGVEHPGPVDWNAELVREDLEKAVKTLKREPGKGLFVGGVKLPLALTELGLIDEYEFVVQPRLVGRGPTLFTGLSK